MKTAGRENPNRWARAPRNRAHGAAGQYRSRSITWAAKQEKFQPQEMCFFLTSTFIERFSRFPRFTDWCSGAFLQLLRNQNFNRLSCRCTPVTSAKDGASCGFAIFRRVARKWPTSQYKRVLGTNLDGRREIRAISATSCGMARLTPPRD